MSTQPLPAPAAPAPDAKGHQVLLRSRVEGLKGFLFVLPALVVLAIFLIYPAYYTIRLAFYEGDFHFGFFHYLRSEERRVGKECRSLCDWSSDVCSSDLSRYRLPQHRPRTPRAIRCCCGRGSRA